MVMNIRYVQETNHWVIDLEETWNIQEDKELNFVTSRLRESSIPYFLDFLEGKTISLSTSITREVSNTKEASSIINSLLLIQENLTKIKPTKPKQKVLEPKIVPEQKPLFDNPVQAAKANQALNELDAALNQPTQNKNIFNRR
jgi:hypothetical protein